MLEILAQTRYNTCVAYHRTLDPNTGKVLNDYVATDQAEDYAYRVSDIIARPLVVVSGRKRLAITPK